MNYFRPVIVLCLAIALLSLTEHSAPAVQGQPGTVSTVYLSPTSTSGFSKGNTTFTVNVMLNLTSGASMNGFDVRLDYTGYNHTSFRAVAIGYTNNIFGASGNVEAACINGIAVPLEIQGCPSSDPPYGGFVHFAEVISGANVTQGGFLFSVQFNVTGAKTSQVLSFNYAHILVAGINLQVVTLAGVYANSGVAAFFNYEPCILFNYPNCSQSPAILPRQTVTFDSTGSFDNESGTITNYSWNFSDRSVIMSGASYQIVRHAFSIPGNYSVQLVITDSNGKTGNMTRTVQVSPALGGLQIFIHDSTGSTIGSFVLVQLFNSTSQSTPTLSATSANSQVSFSGLTPATYVLKFSGIQVLNYTTTASVVAGWTSQDAVYIPLRPVPTPPPDYSGIIFLGSTAAAIAVIASILVLRRRSRNKVKPKTGKSARFSKN